MSLRNDPGFYSRILVFTAAQRSVCVTTRIACSLQKQSMNEEREDFAAKLTMIEREAKLALEDLPPSVIRDRVQHIAIVARLLRARLDIVSSIVLPAEPPKRL